MTAEVAIMNMNGIALAADSAVTIQSTDKGRSDVKVYNSAHKVFSLSKKFPIGCMVYNTGSFMEIPWSVVLKEFRRKNGKRDLSTLFDYADLLEEFLKKSIVPKDVEEEHFLQVAYSYIYYEIERWDKSVEKIIEENGQISDGEIKEVLRNLVLPKLEEHEKECLAIGIKPKDFHSAKRKFSKSIKEIVKASFEKRPVYQTTITAMVDSAIYVGLGRKAGNESGLVVCGFGSDDLFPSLRSYNIYRSYGDRLIFDKPNDESIDHGNHSVVKPFAQSMHISMFMEGLSPLVKNLMYNSVIPAITDDLPQHLISELLSSIPKAQKKEVKDVCRGLGGWIKDEIERLCEEKYVQPVMKAVSFLGVSELAELADSLVSLESLKKRVTLSHETVGGPVDVAVITKGDGFIWIKRKHYFDKELNHNFFQGYPER